MLRWPVVSRTRPLTSAVDALTCLPKAALPCVFSLHLMIRQACGIDIWPLRGSAAPRDQTVGPSPAICHTAIASQPPCQCLARVDNTLLLRCCERAYSWEPQSQCIEVPSWSRSSRQRRGQRRSRLCLAHAPAWQRSDCQRELADPTRQQKSRPSLDSTAKDVLSIGVEPIRVSWRPCAISLTDR